MLMLMDRKTLYILPQGKQDIEQGKEANEKSVFLDLREKIITLMKRKDKRKSR
jgi:hypothetical protein